MFSINVLKFSLIISKNIHSISCLLFSTWDPITSCNLINMLVMSHHLQLHLLNSVCVLCSIGIMTPNNLFWSLPILLNFSWWLNEFCIRHYSFELEFLCGFCTCFSLLLFSHSSFLICACSFYTWLPWDMWTYLEQLVWSISQFDETSGQTQRISFDYIFL